MKNQALSILIVVLAIFASVAADAQQKFVEYVVKDGDTCASIASDVYGDSAQYHLVHQANDLGDPPHILKSGQRLMLPKVSEALLRQGRGSVMFKSPEADWTKAGIGLELYRAWRLNTLEKAMALVEFRDATELALRENTLVVIYGPSARAAAKTQTHARLESGALRARLGQLAGGPVTVESGSATSDLGRGTALLTVDEQQTTRVANHGGDPIVVRGKAGGSVSVDSGFGSKVNRGQRPKPPRPLPPTPAWSKGPTTFPTFDAATVKASWDAVDTAKEYFVELTADARGVRVLQSVYVPATVTELEVQGLAPGEYFATVSAIDDDKFESIPSQRLSLQVVSFGYQRKLRLEDRRFLAGAVVKAPPGLTCAVGGAERSAEVVLTPTKLEPATGGSFGGYSEDITLSCVEASGHESTLVVQAVIPKFALQGDLLEDGQLILPSGHATSLDIVFEGSVPPMVAQADKLDAAFVVVGADRGRVRLVDTGETTVSVLKVQLAGQDVATVPVSVTPRSVPTRIPPVHYELGAAVMLQTAGATLVDPTLSGGGLATARLTGRLLPSDYFSVGLLLDIGGVFSGPNQVIFGTGVEAVGSLPLGRVRPFLGAAAEAWFPTEAGAGLTFEASLGLDIELFYAQGLRLAARGALINEDVDWLSGVGGFAGYYWSF